MSVSRQALCVVYAIFALLALIGTWGNNIDYMGHGFVQANLVFWLDTLANPAARSITVDIFFLGLAVAVWMLLEARRLNVRFVWLYLIFGFLVAISVTIPLFLIHRERALAKVEGPVSAGSLKLRDIVGLVVLGIAFTAYAVVTLVS